MTSVEPPSFTKEAAKVSEGCLKKSTANPLAKVTKVPKDSKKRVWGFLSVKSFVAKALEQAQTVEKKSPKLKKSGPPIVLRGSKDTSGSSPEQAPKKKPKQIDSLPPPSKFLTFPLIRVEPMSFAYPSNLPDSFAED